MVVTDCDFLGNQHLSLVQNPQMELLQDPLDTEDFDPVDFINQRFPTESSLDDLDSFVNDITSQISSLDAEISSAVQSQSSEGRQAAKDIEDARQLIEDLFAKIDDIKVKATESELMVQDLCADIKKLDYAKGHLQTSITSLNRLQMLINAVAQLEVLAAEYQYREAANLLDAVKQFMSHFERYQHITVIIELNRRVEAIRDSLTQHVRTVFSDLAKNIDTVADADLIVGVPGGLRGLADTCLMVDALGTKVRQQILDNFVHRQLVPYEALFGTDKEHFSLDQVDRRWSWFKRLLKYIDSKFSSIFPSHWRIQLRLCLEFIERTKMHMILLLTDMESRDINDVNLLMKALQSTIRFEQEMADKFDLLKEIKKSQENEEAAALVKAKETEMQKQLKKDDKLMYIPTDHSAANKEEETESGFLGLAHGAISGGISGVYDKFLGSYVLLERQNLEEMLRKLSQEEDTADASESLGHVFTSSTHMFVFIKKSVKRCTAFTTGQTFLSLSDELRSCLRQYITMLRSRCPTEISSSPPAFKLPSGMEKNICLMINTAEYCAEVVPQVEQMIQKQIQPSLANKVDFSEEAELFMDFVAYAMKILVYGLLDRLDPVFRAMQQINWGAFEQVGEESAYLHLMSGMLLEAIPVVRSNLASSYFNNFCTKLATEIIQRFQDSITRQKRITDMATQQLLLDTYSLKTLMMQLPVLVQPDPNGGANQHSRTDPKNVPGMYSKLVNTRCTHIEVILKLVGTPDEVLLERFKLMWPDGQSADLQMIMSLKGTKRDSQQQILEMLGLQAVKVFTKTANIVSSSTPGAVGGNATAFAASTAASAHAASAAAFSSMKSLTQDLSSSARSAVGNLKWTGGSIPNISK